MQAVLGGAGCHRRHRHRQSCITPWLSERLGQPFVIENRPGAGAIIGTEVVVPAPADAHTLLMVTTTAAINASLYDKLANNFIRDIAPIAAVNLEPCVMAMHPSFPAKTIPEFIAHAISNPGKINMASPGAGTSAHLSGELFKMMAGVDMLHVPYRGGAGPQRCAERASEGHVRHCGRFDRTDLAVHQLAAWRVCSALGHKRTNAPQQKASSFDHLISEREQLRGDFVAQRLRGREVKTSSYLVGSFDRHAARLLPFENATI